MPSTSTRVSIWSRTKRLQKPEYEKLEPGSFAGFARMFVCTPLMMALSKCVFGKFGL